jgi:hypothetical protein
MFVLKQNSPATSTSFFNSKGQLRDLRSPVQHSPSQVKVCSLRKPAVKIKKQKGVTRRGEADSPLLQLQREGLSQGDWRQSLKQIKLGEASPEDLSRNKAQSTYKGSKEQALGSFNLQRTVLAMKQTETFLKLDQHQTSRYTRNQSMPRTRPKQLPCTRGQWPESFEAEMKKLNHRIRMNNIFTPVPVDKQAKARRIQAMQGSVP